MGRLGMPQNLVFSLRRQLVLVVKAECVLQVCLGLEAVFRYNSKCIGAHSIRSQVRQASQELLAPRVQFPAYIVLSFDGGRVQARCTLQKGFRRLSMCTPCADQNCTVVVDFRIRNVNVSKDFARM